MKMSFEKFMAMLQPTNQTLDNFCDFAKVEQNVEKIRLYLCMLNSLIGSEDLRQSVEMIWEEYPKAFDVLDILIAVRAGWDKLIIGQAGQCISMGMYRQSIDGIMTYLQETGLENLLTQRKVTNLVDYVFGVETGLDSNARKNRVGHQMERSIIKLLEREGIEYKQEVYSSTWQEVAGALGDDEKRFDFVVSTDRKTYLIEVNFYNSGGSKLNEVARSYSEIAPRINALSDFEFVWITDGPGWYKAKNKLQEAYHIIPHVYNLSNIKEFISLLKS